MAQGRSGATFRFVHSGDLAQGSGFWSLRFNAAREASPQASYEPARGAALRGQPAAGSAVRSALLAVHSQMILLMIELASPPAYPVRNESIAATERSA